MSQKYVVLPKILLWRSVVETLQVSVRKEILLWEQKEINNNPLQNNNILSYSMEGQNPSD